MLKNIKKIILNKLVELFTDDVINVPLEPELERVIGVSLSGFLVAIASVCLAIISQENDAMGKQNLLNILFSGLGLFSLFASAFMVDSLLDRKNYRFWYRVFKFLNGGYALFCLIVSGISAGIIYMYQSKANLPLCPMILLMVSSSITLFMKLMTLDEGHESMPFLVTLYVTVFLDPESVYFPLCIFLIFFFLDMFARLLSKINRLAKRG